MDHCPKIKITIIILILILKLNSFYDICIDKLATHEANSIIFFLEDQE